MIKVTIQEALAINQAIQTLSKMPVKAAYRFARIKDKLTPELKQFEEQRNKIFTEAQVPQENNKWKLTPELAVKVQADVEQLLQESIEIQIEPVTLSMLGDQVQIEPGILLILDKLIKEDGDA